MLADLCAYNDKHNDANGEQNRDGSNDNFGWNCGAEGPTQDADILWRRERQMRNLMVALLVAQGTPMVLSGASALRPLGHDQVPWLQMHHLPSVGPCLTLRCSMRWMPDLVALLVLKGTL